LQKLQNAQNSAANKYCIRRERAAAIPGFLRLLRFTNYPKIRDRYVWQLIAIPGRAVQ